MIQPGIFAKQHLLLFAAGAFLPSPLTVGWLLLLGFFSSFHAKVFETIL